MRQDKTGENSEQHSVGGGVQTTDALGNADMCSLSGLCPSLPAHTDVLKTLNLVLLLGFCLFSYYVWQVHRFFHLVRFTEDILKGGAPF